MKTRIPRGFSLLELMIVIVIGAILAGLALPAFRTYFLRSSISSTANSVLSAMNTARAESIKRNVYVRVDPSTCSGAGKWSYGAFVWLPSISNPASDPIPTSNDARVISGTVVADGNSCTSGTNITESIISGSGNVVCYNGGGRMNLNTGTTACTAPATTAPLQIRLCPSSNSVKTGAVVEVASSGRALIQPNVTCP